MKTPDFAQKLLDRVPPKVKHTVKLRTFGAFKIPVLFFLSPTVVEVNDYRCVVKIPLTRRSKNHLGSMYFAALAAGADCAGGLIAMNLVDEAASCGKKISLVFKDFKADFLKRAEGDVLFTCEDGQAIRQMVERVAASGERDVTGPRDGYGPFQARKRAGRPVYARIVPEASLISRFTPVFIPLNLRSKPSHQLNEFNTRPFSLPKWNPHGTSVTRLNRCLC